MNLTAYLVFNCINKEALLSVGLCFEHISLGGFIKDMDSYNKIAATSHSPMALTMTLFLR